MLVNFLEFLSTLLTNAVFSVFYIEQDNGE